MVFFDLFAAFFKIGLFSFGGGYAMIPLIQSEVSRYGWLKASEFANIIAISEMTPGPIAVNSATYIGFTAAGILGSIVATLGVALPSLIVVLIIAKFFFGFQKHPLNESVFYVLRPVIAALIITAAVFVAETAIINIKLTIDSVAKLFFNPLQTINFKSVTILMISVLAIVKLKIHPVLVIMGSGVLGVIFFSF
jgi:chromate transporter